MHILTPWDKVDLLLHIHIAMLLMSLLLRALYEVQVVDSLT